MIEIGPNIGRQFAIEFVYALLPPRAQVDLDVRREFFSNTLRIGSTANLAPQMDTELEI